MSRLTATLMGLLTSVCEGQQYDALATSVRSMAVEVRPRHSLHGPSTGQSRNSRSRIHTTLEGNTSHSPLTASLMGLS